MKLAKAALRLGVGNMVNAFLRKLVLLKENNSLPKPKMDSNDRQQWMVRRWTNYFGIEEAIKLMTWNNTDPFFSIRANTVKGFPRADLVKEFEMLKVEVEAVGIQGPKMEIVMSQVKKLDVSVLVLGQNSPSPFLNSLTHLLISPYNKLTVVGTQLMREKQEG